MDNFEIVRLVFGVYVLASMIAVWYKIELFPQYAEQYAE